MRMIKICEQCGQKFKTYTSTRMYCSNTCKGIAKARLKDPKSYRPKLCHKCCIYNMSDGCGYKRDKPLSDPIRRWQTCQYFDDGEMFKYERAQTPVHLDTIYGHIAAFKDSHSAVWMY